MKILIDMDGIVCNTLPFWLKKIAEKTYDRTDPSKQIVAQVEDIKLWDMMKCPPLDKADPKLVFGILQTNTSSSTSRRSSAPSRA